MTSRKRTHIRRKRKNSSKQESNEDNKIRIFCNHLNSQTGNPCGYHLVMKRFFKSDQNICNVKHACAAYWAKTGATVIRSINCQSKRCSFCTRKFCIRKANKREIAEYKLKSNRKLKENIIYIYCYHVNKETSKICGIHLASTVAGDPKITIAHRCIASATKKEIYRMVDVVCDTCDQNCTGPCVINADDQTYDDSQSNTNVNENINVFKNPKKRKKLNSNANTNENINIDEPSNVRLQSQSNLSYAQKKFQQYLPFNKYYDLFNDKSYANMEFLDIMMDETFLREEIGISNTTDIKIIILQWKKFIVYQKEFQQWLQISGNPFYDIRGMLEQKAIYTRFDLSNIVICKESFDSVFDVQLFCSKILWDYVQIHFI